MAVDPAGAERVLEVRGLRRSYASPGGERALVLDVPELDLRAGEQVALAGASGSGKTTLLHSIAGILRPDSGSVVLAGRDLASMTEPERDRWRALHLGYVFQSFLLLDAFSALENVLLGQLFGAGADRARAEALLQRVGLGDRMHYRPSALSAGQQQRVALARALANRPRLVLADEPTGNLDEKRAREALALLCEVSAESGAALLVVSHDRSVLAAFERTLRIEDVNRAAVAANPA